MKGLTEILQKGLERFSQFQLKNYIPFLIGIVLFTLILGTGWFQLTLQSDFSKMNPSGLPITELTNDIRVDFGELNTVIIAVQLDETVDSVNVPVDIRDPLVFEFLERLDMYLKEDIRVQEVLSPAVAFPEGIPDNPSIIKERLAGIPQMQSLISDDYSLLLVVVSSDLGEDSEKINRFSNRIDEIIELSAPPGGVQVSTTGETPLGATIFRLMINDAVFTSLIALAFIFVLLLILQRSFKDSIVILIPLMVGISWTFSLLGLLDISINIGTVGLSAMLIGLGVEYNIFLVSRFKEERSRLPLAEALKASISNIGASILSSGGTTMIGFFALGTSLFPILAELGISLGIGIFSLLGTTVLVTPLLLIIQDKFNDTNKKSVKNGFNLEKIFRYHGKAVSKYPSLFVILAVFIFGGMFVASQNLNNQDMDFENMLPHDLPAMQSYMKIQDEWGDTTGVDIYLEVLPEAHVAEDIRDPVYLTYIDVLTEKALHADSVLEVNSISQSAKQNGFLPNTLTDAREVLKDHTRVSDDARITIIDIEAAESVNGPELLRQLNEIIETTPAPAGLQTKVIGGLAVAEEQDSIFGPDSARTSMIALLGILVFLFILTRSIKGTLLPITTVILSVMWTLGLIGIFRIPYNNVTSSVITMTIGIGIDFGIQLMNRYQFELKTHDRRKAMEEAITNVLRPMLITVIAAVIGFRAMTFGDLNIMGDLGSTMSVAMVASMFAAITGVAGLLVLLEKKKKKVIS